MTTLKVCVMGAGAVGKSNVTTRYVVDRFVDVYEPTIEDAFRKQVQLGEGGPYRMVEILDTAGTDQFSALRHLYLKSADAYVLVYSVDDRRSADEVMEIYDKLVAVRRGDDADADADAAAAMPPVVVVANKCDLDDKQRTVPATVLEVVARHCGDCPRFEASAKLGVNVAEAFGAALKGVVAQHDAADAAAARAAGGKRRRWRRRTARVVPGCSVM